MTKRPDPRASGRTTRISRPVNLTEFRHMMREAGIGETADRILVVFSEDAPGRMADLEAALRQRDAKAIRMAAHVFKSAAATIRADALAQLLGRIEAAAESDDIEAAAKLLPQVRAEAESVQTFLDPLQHPD